MPGKQPSLEVAHERIGQRGHRRELMKELFRSNDPVKLSWLQALLTDAGIDCLLLDNHASVIEGSIGAIQRRIMVADDDLERAHELLTESGEESAW